jgi:lysophospholipase L1-like esterase
MRKYLHAARDGWSIIGLSLLAVFAVEAGYRLQASVRRSARESLARPRAESKALHPNAAQAWFEAETASGPLHRRNDPLRYDPYRGWWLNPVTSPRANIDSAGLRVTPQRSATSGSKRLVFAFGGSTMWGFQAADSTTIPAQIARRLHDRGAVDAQVVNFAQSAYNVTQGVISLMLELRRGNIPDVVVFLDGHNDVAAAFFGSPGQIMNQGRAEQTFLLGRRRFSEELVGLGRHSALVTRLQQIGSRSSSRHPAQRTASELCDSVASQYRNLVRMVEGLGREFGFSALFFWQPLLANSSKRKTSWEASIRSPRGFREALRTCSQRADSLLKDRMGKTYFPLHAVFDPDTSSVFLDDYGHVTERGYGIIADHMVGPIMSNWNPGRERP